MQILVDVPDKDWESLSTKEGGHDVLEDRFDQILMRAFPFSISWEYKYSSAFSDGIDVV